MTPRPSPVRAVPYEAAGNCPRPTPTGADAGGPVRVLVVSGSVGAGHDGAARELAVRLRRAGVQVDVRDLLDVLPFPVPQVLRDGYRLAVDRMPIVFDTLFDALETGGPVRGAMLVVCRLGEAGVAGWLGEQRYDAVVSTYPLASQVLGGLRDRGLAPMPLLTYLTDPAVHRSWLHASVDRHLTVTDGTAAQGRADYGVPMTAAGPLVPERFSRACSRRRLQQLRAELGLAAGVPVALLVAGSLGLGDLVPSVRHVAAAGVLPLVLCGRNERLRERVARVPTAVALGWRDDVHELMELADVLVHNAGGLSFTEAVVSGLPAVSYRCIPGHGRANAALLRDSGLAPWADTPDQLSEALWRQLSAGRGRRVLPDPAEAVLSVLPSTRLAPGLAASA